MRKTRRKIKRRKRDKKQIKRRKSLYSQHMDSSITNRWTKLTTYFIMLFEAVFVIWWIQETVLNWEELVLKFGAIFYAIGNMIQMLIEKIGGLF